MPPRGGKSTSTVSFNKRLTPDTSAMIVPARQALSVLEPWVDIGGIITPQRLYRHG
jgi:hypothetical protein